MKMEILPRLCFWTCTVQLVIKAGFIASAVFLHHSCDVSKFSGKTKKPALRPGQPAVFSRLQIGWHDIHGCLLFPSIISLIDRLISNNWITLLFWYLILDLWLDFVKYDEFIINTLLVLLVFLYTHHLFYLIKISVQNNPCCTNSGSGQKIIGFT